MIERTANFVSEDGVLKMTSKDWGGTIYRIKRDRIVPNILNSDNLNDCAGIYILIGEKNIRIGKGDIYSRLSNHRSSNDLKRNFFDYVIVITAIGGLDDTQQGYIEHCWIKKLKEYKKYTVTNDVTPDSPRNIQEHDKISADKFMAAAEKFIQDICNEPIFENVSKKAISQLPIAVNTLLPAQPPKSEPIGEEFICKNGYCEAKGIYLTGRRIKVLKGSIGRLIPAPSFSTRSCYNQIRENLIKENKIISDGNFFIFQDDIEFESPSAASSVSMGTPSSGLHDWKKNGKSLKEFV